MERPDNLVLREAHEGGSQRDDHAVVDDQDVVHLVQLAGVESAREALGAA